MPIFCTVVIAPTILYGPEQLQSCINRGYVLLACITSHNARSSISVQGRSVLQRGETSCTVWNSEVASCLTILKDKLNYLLPDIDNIRVVKIWFRINLIDNEGKVTYKLIELNTYKYLKAIWRTIHRRITKRPIELFSI